MLTVPELILIAVIIVVVFGMHKLPAISRGVARMRLKFDKSVAEEAIELAEHSGDHGQQGTEPDAEPDEQRGA